MNKSRENDPILALCETVRLMAEQNRAMCQEVMAHQRRIVDRALSVCDFGLDAKKQEVDEIVAATNRAVSPRSNGEINIVRPFVDPKPDVFVADGDPNG